MIKEALLLFVVVSAGALCSPPEPEPRQKRGFSSGYDTISHSYEDAYSGPALTSSGAEIPLPETGGTAHGSYGVHDHHHHHAVSSAVIRAITIHKDISVPVPQPYPVPVERPVPFPVKVPVKVPVDQPYPVPVDKPYPVYVDRPVPVRVYKDVPVEVPVSVPVHVRVPVAVPVPRPVPVPHYVPRHFPIHKSFPVKVILREHKGKGWWW